MSDVHQLAINAGLAKRIIQAEPFLLTSYERVSSKNDVAHVYIEGDGNAWLSRHRPSLDPTPRNPLALKLALEDSAENVIYLARPCQYSENVDSSPCEQKYWTSHRFSPEVIDAMNAALDALKVEHAITQFHLIGFSGGGNIAALLAAQRNDVASLRTVAGNLDHALQSKTHNISPMPASLNARDAAQHIAHIPQIHFVGESDDIVPIVLADSYHRAMGDTSCSHIMTLPNMTHHEWDKEWSALLRHVPKCNR